MSSVFDQILFRDMPTAARREVFPSLSFGLVYEAVPAGGSAIIKHSNGLSPILSEDWLIGVRSLMSWRLHPLRAAGVVLNIALYDTSLAAYYNWKTFPLFGLSENPMSGLYVPGFKCQLTLVNANATQIQNVSGHIKIEAVS